jgi:phosphoribosylamine---glycine ligase
MRVLVIGNGGREHALVWKLRQSPQVTELFCAPGNPGIAALADCVPIDGSNIVELADFALSVNINLTVVGPELPLDLGIVDEFDKRNLPIFGPSGTAAELESSKVFAKEFMRKHKIPTARFEIAGGIEEARNILKKGDLTLPVVLKADGLAGGKGVLICETKKHVADALDLFMTERKFGNAGDRIVVEEFLEGIEISYQVISDGKKVLPLATSQDHKRLIDGDRGPNTGGMGAYSPALSMNKEMHQFVMNQVILPAISGMAAEGRPYRGVLYAGLMLTKQGPRVLEFNCRFGDPETQSLLPRMECDLAGVLMSAVTGRLDEAKVEWKREAAVCVVLASAGYPGTIESGREITGLDQADALENVVVFHAGTAKKDDKLVTSGGRVLGVTATAPHLTSACDRAYAAIGKIQFEGMQYRKDIAQKALQHLGDANKLE